MMVGFTCQVYVFLPGPQSVSRLPFPEVPLGFSVRGSSLFRSWSCRVETHDMLWLCEVRLYMARPYMVVLCVVVVVLGCCLSWCDCAWLAISLWLIAVGCLFSLR